MFRRFPCVLQRDSMDCGPACIATVALKYNKQIPLAKIREHVGTDTTGSNVYGMIRGLEFLGFSASAVKADYIYLSEEKNLIFPMISHILSKEGFEHYVVIHSIEKKKIIVADPAYGIKKYSLEEFQQIWTGILILVYNNNTLFTNKVEENLFTIVSQLLSYNKTVVFKIILVSSIGTIISIGTSFYFKFIIDSIIPDDAYSTLYILMIGLILFGIINISVNLFRSYLLLFFNQLIESSLFLGAINHLIRLPLQFFNSSKTGDIISKIIDSSKIKTVTEESILTIFVDVPMAIITGAILFLQNQKLFFVSLLLLFFYIISTLLSRNSIRKTTQITMENTSKLNSLLIQTIGATESIKSYNLEKIIETEIKFSYSKLLNSIFKMNITQFYPTTFNLISSKVGVLIIMWMGSLEVMNKSITLGELIVFETLLSYFLDPMKNIVDFQLIVQSAKVAVDRLNDIMEVSKENNENKLVLESLKLPIIINNVSFRYLNNQLCLKNISFNIFPGERVALVGESGSGKTTILKLLLKFYDFESGNIFIGNYNLKDLNSSFIRDKIAYISQNNFLFNKSIKDNLMISSIFSFEEVIQIVKNSEIFNFIEKFPQRFDFLVEENGTNLSTGQKQRLAILRAILKKPDILIMDESTSNLDSISEFKLQECIKKIIPNSTQIVVSHRLNFIKNCDNIFVMDNGFLIEFGKHDKLLGNKGKYYNLWKEQNQDYEI